MFAIMIGYIQKAISLANFEILEVGNDDGEIPGGELRLVLPNPVQTETSKDLPARILRQALINRTE
jgi:hypothetical protein